MQLIAMHGWAGDAQGWEPFHSAWSARGWTWQCGERGYGRQAPQAGGLAERPGAEAGDRPLAGPPSAARLRAGPGRCGGAARQLRSIPARGGQRPPTAQRRGSHGKPAGRPGSQLHAANLHGARRSPPQPSSLLPPGIAAAPIAASGRQRLAEDLNLLAATAGLPPGFPLQARVLIVEGGEDQIVNPQARHQLRNLLPAADNLVLAGVGHCLLSPALVPTVCGWIEGLP